MDIGIPELVIVLLAIVLLFGPGRIAGLGKELGSGIREFKEGLDGRSEAQEPDEQAVEPKNLS